MITITYKSNATAYVYADAQKEYEGVNYSAYYKQDVTAAFDVEDTYPDSMFIDGKKTEETSAAENCKEGVNVFTVYGTDKAGNPATVKEVWEGSVKDETGEDIIATVGKGDENHGDEAGKYTVQVATVIDKTGPTVSFSATSRTDENSLEDGIRRYYNNTFEGTFTVEDTNPIDPALITANVLLNDGTEFYNEVTADTDIADDAAAAMTLSGEGRTITYKGTASKAAGGVNDGVYRFYIAGTDKAGNPLEISAGNTADDENKVSKFAKGEPEEYLISQPKVLDTVAPTANLLVKAGGKTIYDLKLELNKKVDVYAPFQKVTAPSVEYTSDDKSPVKMGFTVNTTDPSKKEEERKTALKSEFKNNNNELIVTTKDEEGNESEETVTSYEMEAKKQIITLTGIAVADRAGNRTTLTKSNELIFDGDAPKADTVAPKATIKATSAVTHRNADRRDLFRNAPTITITVTDPGAGESSSGLKTVSYDVYVDGKKVDSDSVSYTDYVKPAEAITQDEDKQDQIKNNDLTYEKVFKVQLDDSYQTNNITIRANAVDNSGNKMPEEVYYCGIDGEGPEIVVSYDNNSARNGKYFKANRTATITVTDRNVDNGKIRINTQVSVPGSFDYKSGGGNGASDKWTKRLNYNKDGDYTLRLGKCTDALGNPATITYTGTAPNEFIVDKTLPTIKVDFDNNNVQNQKYYKDPRTATVTVTDHNFSAADTRIDTQVTPGGFRNESRDIHKANVTYSQDGVYTMYVTTTDLAGNTVAQPVRIDEFVIDRTAPVINVSFDNNDAQNGKYYKSPRVATVSIREHNFRDSDVKITQTADIQQGSVSAPGVGGFGGGGDDHSASINYNQDGNFTIEVNYTDLAGNPAQVVRVDEFVIDQTPPTLKFVMPNEEKGTSQIFAGDIAPQIEFGDINMTRGMASITLSGMKGNSDVLKLLEDSFENYKGTVRYENLKKVRESDDIYTATAVVTDLAGNTVEKKIVFSVNRFGSTYDYNGDEYTTNLVKNYYTNQEHDVVLREINVNQLTEHKLTLYRDGENRTLVEGTDYSFVENQVNGHYEYIYTIFAKNFEEEGNYNIIATSKDKAKNTSSNSTVKGNDGSNEVPLRFAIDKTAPTNLITGIDLSKDKFTESSITLLIEPQDNMNAVARFRVKVIDRDGNVLHEFELSGEELADFLEKNNGIYTLTVDQNNKWQTIEILTTDAAGNESVDYSIEQNTAKDVLVTTNLFYQYINRLPLVLLSGAGIGGLIFFLIWKRKKDEEEETAA